MIEIIGHEGSSEYEAAVALKDAFAKMWPGCESTPLSQDDIRIAVSVKISGYAVSDIDIVFFCKFGRARKFVPTYPVNNKLGKPVQNKAVTVQNLVVAVEVKDHSEGGVRRTGDRIDVKYKGNKWHSATDQNVAQVHSLKHYLEDKNRNHDKHEGNGMFIQRCLIMRGLFSLECPGAVSSGFDGPGFLTAVAATSRVMEGHSGYILSSGDPAAAARTGRLPIFKELKPTAIDRLKMDAIVSMTPESEAVVDALGKSFIALRGRGGTGKTIMLLQAAWNNFQANGTRTIVLTYNHALASDIRRILALLRVPADPESGGITVRTVMGFMSSWFYELEIESDLDGDFQTKYESSCRIARELIDGGAISTDDVTRIKDSNPTDYEFDAVVVDESQDWPQSEADLLKVLYGSSRIAIADGLDQLVRGERTRWMTSGEKQAATIIPLETCMRMKRNLASFANAVGKVSGTAWTVTPNDAAGGGRVVILKREYSNYPELHERLVSSAKSGGNSEVDFLFCVPSDNVSENETASELGKTLTLKGFEVWDGVDLQQRKDFPRSLAQFRIVQYASCRGLEGWTVVLEGLDRYWQEMKDVRHEQGLSHEEAIAMIDINTVAEQTAWLRSLIAITRSIDTLVITISDENSPLSIDLLSIADQMQDSVEVYE